MLDPVRKTSAVLASLSLVALALTGCSSAPSFAGATCDRAASASSSLADSVTATGDIGSKPDVEVFAPVVSTTAKFADLVTGEGEAIVSDTQPFIVDISLYDGATGAFIQSTKYDPTTTQPRDISTWSQSIPALADALQCATAGSRVVDAIPSEQLGADAGQTVIAVIDVETVFLPKAEGTPQFNDARGVPTVVRAPDGTPGVIIPDSAAPTDTVVQTLIKGDGAKIEEDDYVVVNHMMLNWDDKSITGNSWNTSSLVTAPLPQMVGATVGSQLMIITPAADASSSAQVLVVDILGISPAAPTQN